MKGRIPIILALLGSLTVSSMPVVAQDLELELALEAIQSTPPMPPAYLPESGTYHSAQHPFDWPPFPANMHGLAAWDLGDGFFLLDDGLFDYEAMSEVMAAAGFPFGGPMMSMQSYSSNDLWLEINGVAEGCTDWTADLTIHRPVNDTNSSYDLLYTPNLGASTDWEFLMRVPTNIISQTNVYARYLCEARGFFKLAQTNGTLTVDTNVTAQAMAERLVPQGVTLTNVIYVGKVVARGVFSNGNSCGLPIESGVILSSGYITNALGPNDDGGSDGESVVGGDPDTDLDQLVGGQGTDDTASLEFDIISTNDLTISFRYVYASEEYPEYSGADKNDPMAIFVTTNLSGTNWVNDVTNNIAIVPCTDTNPVPITVNTVRGGTTNDAVDNAFVAPTNAQYYLDNSDEAYGSVPPHLTEVPVLNTQYDGMTVLLEATTTVEAGVTTHVKIAIADYSDLVWDSSVFLERWSENSWPELNTLGNSNTSSTNNPPAPK
jgi:hypothetical protein